MQNPLPEIQSFIDHHDYSLAVRRMLDTALDSGNASILKQAIVWSKSYHKSRRAGSEAALPESFHSEASALLSRLGKESHTHTYTQHTLVNADNISKTYSRGNFSLKPISLKINTGDILGIVGQNGNGKTTLLRCLAGQLSLDGGQLQFDHLTIADHYSIKQQVAFIPQRIPKWYGLLKDNLHFSASVTGVTDRENDSMVDFMLERLDLSDYADLTWNQISSGYRTRFELARVLLQKPRLLILDEPLANLDISAQQTILTDLRYIAKLAHNPMGVILSSQQLHEVENIADTVLFIKEGTCLFRTGDEAAIPASQVIELETPAGREAIINAIGEQEISLQFNGGFYTITSSSLTAQEIINRLISRNITVSYFRDITHSTKRFF
ncbi:MAG: ABC transporter ATP-binding protein [Chitinophagaceae bacterium]|nr:ABC transporter ATP-binding protein [Chitinophagaceae bacterium]